MEEFLREYHEEEILDLLSETDKIKSSLNIDLTVLKLFNKQLFFNIISNVYGELEKWNKAIQDIQSILKENTNNYLKDSYELKEHIYARFINLPVPPESGINTFPNINNLGELVEIKGTILHCQQKQIQEVKRIYSCKKCKCKVIVESE